MIKDFIAEMREATADAGYCTINFSPDDIRDFQKVLDIAEAAENRETTKQDFSGEAAEILKSIGAKKAVVEVNGNHLQSLNIYGTLGEDQTKKYAGMIQAFECDFALAAEPESRYGLDDLQVKIEQRDKRLMDDIRLLREFSFGLRDGKIRIIRTEGRT